MDTVKNEYKIVHHELVCEYSNVYKDKLCNSDIAAEFAKPFFKGADKEKAYVCVLDNKLNPIYMEQISAGSRKSADMDMPAVFKSAMLISGSSIILYHNHISNSAKPSECDISITNKAYVCGKLLGVDVKDHIIISASGEHYSIRRSGEFERFNTYGLL